MNKIALTSLLSLSTLLAAPSAFAQIYGGGGISIGGSIQFGSVPQPPPPPPPPQQMIVVEQQPVYIQPPPQRVYVTTVPTYTYTTTTTVTYLGAGRARGFGLGGFVGGMGFGSRGDGARGLGGLGLSLRYRQHANFATELAASGMVGTDYNSDSRLEVPVTLSELFYFNPQNRFQIYAVLGVGVSWASVAYNDNNISAHRGLDAAAYTYVGGLGGLGAEWQLSPNFSLYGDARAFIRTRIDREANNNPEFSRVNSDGRTENTNVSVGVLGQLGGIFYF